jgi:hypothetical protein
VRDVCHKGKSHQFPFSSSTHVIKSPLELIYSDVWGNAQPSVSGHTYYVSFIDAYSRFTWFYLLRRKSDVFDVFLKVQTHGERLLGHKILHVQSDWVGRGGASIATLIPSLINLALFIVSRVLILLNKTVLPSANTVTLLKLGLHCLLMAQFRFIFGVMRFPLLVFLLTGFLHVFSTCKLLSRNS